MKLPYLTELQRTRQVMNTFGGYHHSLKISDGEMYDMANLTSDHYPILATRESAQTVYHGDAAVAMPEAIIAKEKLCYARGGKFYIDHEEVPDFALSDEPKQLVSMGAYAVIFPDKKYINTSDTTDKGELEASYYQKSDGTNLRLSLCEKKKDKWEHIRVDYIADEFPDAIAPAKGDVWIDTSTEPPVKKVWDDELEMWKSGGTMYVEIMSSLRSTDSQENIENKFKKGDWVSITTNSDVTEIKRIVGSWEVIDTGTEIVSGTTYGFIIIPAAITLRNVAIPDDKYLEIRRKVPELDFVTEGSNRLWGCKYGVVNGKTVNEIYACALGDFKNWNKFGGIATDSYAASIGTDGPFTGAVTYNGYPIFFKEDRMHRVYGSYPANYQITDVKCNGVKDGAAKSLSIVNNVLYYVSRAGVMAYDGTVPTEISGSLGDGFVCQEAVGGGLLKKYFVSLKNGDTDTLFVFDADKGLWHRVGTDFHITSFCCWDNALLFTERDGEYLRAFKGTGDDYRADEEAVAWYAESGLFNTDEPDRKYISMLTIRMALAVGAEVAVEIQYDSSGYYLPVCKLRGRNLRSFNVPVRPRRCDHFRVRISGKGAAKIFSITATVDEGSEIVHE
jgi:hypothetical protein